MNIWGAPVPEEPSWGVIEGPDGPIARVQGARDHESDDDGLVLLVLGNARLRASIRARTRDLRGAQRQIVQTSDAESRRLERDLHDGGQQHLVSALMFLGAAADEAEGPRGLEIDVARESVREGLAQLRTLSRGLLPDAIHNDGVWNALEHAARSRGVTCRIVADGNADLPEDVASAVFFVGEAALLVAEAADQIGGTDASIVIRASHDDSSVRVRITVSDRRFEPSGFVDPADRIGALDGVLWIDESGAIEVVVPCAS
jgi:signal transduction histidine kinase